MSHIVLPIYDGANPERTIGEVHLDSRDVEGFYLHHIIGPLTHSSEPGVIVGFHTHRLERP